MDGQSRHKPADPRAALLALARAPGVGGQTLARLLNRFGSPEAVLDAPEKEFEELSLNRRTREALQSPDWQRVGADLRWLDQEDHFLLREGDPQWPGLLHRIADPPAILYGRGDPDHLDHPQLAMVGSRNPTATGRDTAQEFARYLTELGLTITSGLAAGIDAAAHEGALAAGGPTVAVLGSGPDVTYPRRNQALAERVAAHGVIVSELPPGTEPRREHFPRRNRIISGLSLGTLVVEAALRSGSLITARVASEQGREVFALPGSIHNPLARGCHRLIRDGAKLVESADHILEELAPQLTEALNAPREPRDAAAPGASPEPGAAEGAEYQQLLEHIGFDPTPVDRIIERSGLTPASVSSMLLLLELEGRVASTPGGCYQRRS